MIPELLAVGAMALGGCALMRAAGLRGWGVVPLGFLAGACLFVTIGLLQVALFLPTTPAVTIALTAAGPVAWWLVRWRRGHDVLVSLPIAGLVAVVLAATVWLLRMSDLMKFHTDSIHYLMSGWLLAEGTYRADASAELFTKRGLGVPYLHAAANLDGSELYLRSVTPLLAVATLAAIVWFFAEAARGQISRGRLAAFAGLGLFALVTTNRYVFNAFYLNGHLFAAAQLLLIVGAGWLLARPADGLGQTGPASGWDRRRALELLQLLALPALVVTRAEGFVLAAVALLPTLLSPAVSLSHRRRAIAIFGAACVAWNGFLTVVALIRDWGVSGEYAGGLAAGLLALAAAFVPLWSRLDQWPVRMLWVAEGALWLVVLAFAVRRPTVLIDSARATYVNLFHDQGLWGYSMVALSAVVAIALVLYPFRDQVQLRFPLTTFVPLAIVLAYVREGAYRVGPGDSLARMLIQYVPLAMLITIVAFATSRRAVAEPDPQTGSIVPEQRGPNADQRISTPAAPGL